MNLIPLVSLHYWTVLFHHIFGPLGVLSLLLGVTLAMGHYFSGTIDMSLIDGQPDLVCATLLLDVDLG